ncbi:hypothetical protein HPB50_006713 [Hyalomma asiaticum]|uniref:Uncharacterized protein n=1 Tax=Hyalomma asiaticum TaxID=266040 RepID=A0ACB7RS77_HYAAI|nr:hypothetical protein HPB50_006713 [Hyalomma asiaticum]
MLVMIGVVEKYADIEDLRHTIYAVDVTLWVTSASDAHIEATVHKIGDKTPTEEKDRVLSEGVDCLLRKHGKGGGPDEKVLGLVVEHFKSRDLSLVQSDKEDKTRPHKAVYIYSDYATCTVISFAYEGKDYCTMWVKRERVLDVHQKCLEKYNEICRVGVTLFDRETCRDDDDSRDFTEGLPRLNHALQALLFSLAR